MKALIAVDETEQSKEAVRFAEELLGDEVEVVVLNVASAADGHRVDTGPYAVSGPHRAVGGTTPIDAISYPYPYPAANEPASRVAEMARGRARRRMHAIADSLDPKRVLVRFGDPSDQICRTAEALGADLVVLGTRDPGPIRRLFTGSVSRKVVDHAPCPVLVVRS